MFPLFLQQRSSRLATILRISDMFPSPARSPLFLNAAEFSGGFVLPVKAAYLKHSED